MVALAIAYFFLVQFSSDSAVASCMACSYVISRCTQERKQADLLVILTLTHTSSLAAAE